MPRSPAQGHISPRSTPSAPAITRKTAIFGTERPTALGRSVTVFPARLMDLEMQELIPASLLEMGRRVRETKELTDVYGAKSTRTITVKISGSEKRAFGDSNSTPPPSLSTPGFTRPCIVPFFFLAPTPLPHLNTQNTIL